MGNEYVTCQIVHIYVENLNTILPKLMPLILV